LIELPTKIPALNFAHSRNLASAPPPIAAYTGQITLCSPFVIFLWIVHPPYLMALITALLHTQNDALRLGRCLETLYPCDEVLIVDHDSRDQTLRVAREYGAKVVAAQAPVSSEKYFANSPTNWLLCLDPRESLTEALAASLFEWKSESLIPAAVPLAFFLREETASGWIGHPSPQTRLVPAGWPRWNGRLPVSEPPALTLQGEILRFTLP